MTNVGELEAVVENEKGRKSAAGSSQMMPPYDAAVLTMVRSTFISTIIIHMVILLISAKRDNLNESSASRICSIELSAEHQLPSSYSLQSASGLQYFDISNGIEIVWISICLSIGCMASLNSFAPNWWLVLVCINFGIIWVFKTEHRPLTTTRTRTKGVRDAWYYPQLLTSFSYVKQIYIIYRVVFLTGPPP